MGRSSIVGKVSLPFGVSVVREPGANMNARTSTAIAKGLSRMTSKSAREIKYWTTISLRFVSMATGDWQPTHW